MRILAKRVIALQIGMLEEFGAVTLTELRRFSPNLSDWGIALWLTNINADLPHVRPADVLLHPHTQEQADAVLKAAEPDRDWF